MMTKHERIKEAYKYLFGKGIIASQKDIAERTGANKASISLVFKGDEKYLTDNFFRRFSEAFPIINESWLISETGEMTNEKIQSNTLKPTHEGKIKYYDIDATAGQIEMFDPKNGAIYKDVIIPGFGDCEIALNVWGDSMEPVLSAGEIILCKEWTESFIEYGKVFLIVTKKNNRMIKYIQPGKTIETITCESENDYYTPFEVAREEIYKLFIIKGHIARNEI